MNAIGPIWDGNEVWLVTFGGAMFAAFPPVYASIFSSFYTAFMLLLCGLIFRAVSMEFRSKRHFPVWRAIWDGIFFASSALVALLFGVATGNTMQGIAIDGGGVFQGSFFGFLNPFALLSGLLVVALFAMHGGIYLIFKTHGDLRRRISKGIWASYTLFVALYVVTSIYALLFVPNATVNFRHYPIAWVMPALNVLAVAAVPHFLYRRQPGRAFLASSFNIMAFVFLFGIAMFPNLVHSKLDSAFHLTIYNAASSVTTLKIMLLIALIGMPLVVTYTILIYRVFRGKVDLEHENSY
jgi:cytochrome d ubiquinol oxidase subunit II